MFSRMVYEYGFKKIRLRVFLRVFGEERICSTHHGKYMYLYQSSYIKGETTM